LDTAHLNPDGLVRPDYSKSSEQAFYDALVHLVPQTQAAQEQRNYQQLVAALVQISPQSATFDGDECFSDGP